MASASLQSIARYCDQLLNTPPVPDFDGAVNGLQIERAGAIKRLAAAVDASTVTVEMAAQAGADLLLVHHGLFWSARQPWTGTNYRLLRLLIDNNLAVYSSHLPLDVHPRLGNNAQLCRKLGFKRCRPFLPMRGLPVGLKTLDNVPLKRLASRVGKIVGGPVHVIAAGPRTCRRIGVVTGGAGGELAEAAGEGVDTFITGEGAHWTHAMAEELKVNVLYAGHYATETFGVKALGDRMATEFGLEWEFLDFPTGM